MASKRAGQAITDAKGGLFRRSGGDWTLNFDYEMEMRQIQKELKEAKVLFDETLGLDDGNLLRVWVEKLALKGLRN